MGRYVVDPDDAWRIHDNSYGFGVSVEVRDLIDTRSGTRYVDGAHRVVSENDAQKTKVFKGESAWSAAQRLAYDYVSAILFGRSA